MQSKFLNKLALTFLLTFAATLASNAAITGQWDFKAGNLTATTGLDLQYFDGPGGPTEQQTVFGTTAALGLPDIGGQPAHVMGFPRSLPQMGYLMRPNMQPNGGGEFVNQYTLIFDMLFPAESANGWRALIQIDDPSNANDADLFINPAGGIGISGAYQGVVQTNTWHRIAVAVDLAAPGGPQLRKYIDGQLVGQQILGAGVDGRWALGPVGGFFGETALLFTDNNADGSSVQPGFVSSIQVHDVALSSAYLAGLGAPKTDEIQTEVAVPVLIASRIPSPGAMNVAPGKALEVILTKGSEPFDTGSITLSLNGQPLSPAITSENENTTVRVALPALAARSTTTVRLRYVDPAQGGEVSAEWTFRMAAYNLDAPLASSFPQGLTAYWKLDEGLTNTAATTLLDTARDNHGTLTAPSPETAWQDSTLARFGGALWVNGQDVFGSIPASDTLDINTNQVTLSLWVKLEQLPSEIAESFGGIYDSVEDSYAVYLDKAAGELRFKVTDANGQAARPGIPQSLLKTAEWLHVVAVYDGQASSAAGEARIYLNGELADTHVGSDASVGSGLTGAVKAGQAAALGRNGTQAAYFLPSAIDDVAVWSRALSVDEIGYLSSGHPVPLSTPLTVPTTIASQSPGPGAMNAAPGAMLEVVLKQGTEPLNTGTIGLILNGQTLSPAITSQDGKVSIRSRLPALAARSTNTVRLRWTDPAQGGEVTTEWTFRMAPYNLDTQLAGSFPQGLTAYWKLDEGLTNTSATTLLDTALDNDATLNAPSPEAAWLGSADAKFGGALLLEDPEVFGSIPTSDSLNINTNQVTVSLWVKISLLPSQLSESFGAILDAVEDDYVVYLDRGNKELRFKVTATGGNAARPGIPEKFLKTNEWMHIVGRYDGQARTNAGEARIYLNGELADTHLGSDSSVGSGLTAAVRPGQVASLGRNGVQPISILHGAVDDVAIWSRALSVDEIGYLSSGHAVPLSAPVTVPTTIASQRPAPGAMNVLPGATLEVALKQGTEPLNTGLIGLTLNGQPLSPAITSQDGKTFIRISLPILAARSQITVRLRWTDPAQGGEVSAEWTFRMAPYTLDAQLAASLPQGLTAYWHLDDGLTNPGATTLEDSAGDNDGTLTAPTPATAWLSGADARYGGALLLDGANVFGTMPKNTSLDINTNQVTISLWVKSELLPSQLSESFGSIYDAVEDDYVLYLDRGSKELRFKVTATGGNAARPGIPESLLKTNEWMHVVGVYDGQARTNAGEARIYLNGQLADLHAGNDGSNPPSGLTAAVRAGQTAALGRNGTEARYFFRGAVDDIAIWRRALSVDEIGYLASGQTVPGAILQITSVKVEPPTVTVTWTGGPGTYTLQRRTSLTAGDWENVGAPTSASQAADTISGQSAFYRVRAN